MKQEIKYKSIKLREDVYKKLKIEAVKHECSMLELVERMISHIEDLNEGELVSVR